MTRGGRTLVCPAWDCPAHGQTKVRPTFQDYSSAFLPALDGALDRGRQSGGRPIAGQEEIVESSSARRAQLRGSHRVGDRGVVFPYDESVERAHTPDPRVEPLDLGVDQRDQFLLPPARSL